MKMNAWTKLTVFWISLSLSDILGFPGDSDSKELACNAEDLGLVPGSRRLPWRREWLPTPVFLSGKLHGQRSLVDYSFMGSQRAGHDWATNTFTFLPSIYFLDLNLWVDLKGTSIYFVSSKSIGLFVTPTLAAWCNIASHPHFLWETVDFFKLFILYWSIAN